MKNYTNYTVKEIAEKWLPNAEKMYQHYLRCVARNERGAKKSAAFWAVAVCDYRAIIADPQNK